MNVFVENGGLNIFVVLHVIYSLIIYIYIYIHIFIKSIDKT